MKRALLIAASAVVVLVVACWLALPRYITFLTDRSAAEHRLANHLPADALHALASDPRLTLFSIDPERSGVDSPLIPAFHRWGILGQTTVAPPEQRQQLADTLQQGLSRWSGREIVGCFNPRHAIRATDGQQTFDFLICFECGQICYYPPNSEQRRQLHIRTKAGPFDEILAAAHIPMPTPAPHP